MNHSPGFTVVEFLVAIVFIGIVGTVAFGQKQSLEAVHRDQTRKIAINAIHYNLEEVVKPALGSYPRILKTNQLKAMDPTLLDDPSGNRIATIHSDYRYEPTGCNGGDTCSGYVLRAELEHESDFIKSSPQTN